MELARGFWQETCLPASSAAVTLFGHGQDDKAVHSQQRGRAATTVTHVPCPPVSLVW